MKTIDIIKNNIAKINIIEAFNAENEPDWMWVNKYVINDVLYSFDLDEDEDEELYEEEEELSEAEEKEILEVIGSQLVKMGYVAIDQEYFAFWEEGYKATEDIETVIYAKEKICNKMSIDMHNKFQWVLQSLAIDTYYKIETNYENLEECFKDMYEDNDSIIERLLKLEPVTFSAGRWEIRKKDQLLIFYKEDQFMNSWTEAETMTKYEELK